MSYVAPSIGPAGLTVPAYADILASLITSYQSIFGTNVYLQPDAARYQWISVLAAKLNDNMGAIQLAYNARSAQTAVGADLDAIALMIPLTRLPAVAAQAALTIGGTVGTVITNGIAMDQQGNEWQLPSPLTIPTGGSIVVTAVCLTPGPVSAAIGTINIPSTPTAGWNTVTNAAAVPASASQSGQAVETDSDFRGRIAISTGLRSLTTLDATIAAIAAVDGVTRYNVLENFTGSNATMDGITVNAHSIAVIVEGGVAEEVALAIYYNRGIGCGMNAGVTGFNATSITDPVTGYTMNVYFSLPTYRPVFTSLTVNAFAGYTSATRTAIQTAITNYLNSLQIGENVSLAALYAVAMSVNPNISVPLFSITAFTLGFSASPTGTADLNLNGNQVAQGVTADCVITP